MSEDEAFVFSEDIRDSRFEIEIAPGGAKYCRVDGRTVSPDVFLLMLQLAKVANEQEQRDSASDAIEHLDKIVSNIRLLAEVTER